jgi:hypothetical protein
VSNKGALKVWTKELDCQAINRRCGDKFSLALRREPEQFRRMDFAALLTDAKVAHL